ncbi:MAG: CDP-alcohol phosphatidyltransferase family protein [Candidatus Bathyarchaeota archaeon]|nr:CDP-alcohol phosphatidyltransferase family protein [Candidatus Bathyarchaeota archaeon]
MGKLREKYEKAIAPAGRLLGRLGITPNALSALCMVISVGAFWFYSVGNAILGAVFILLTGIVDMLDGAVARATGKMTRFGAVFDHVLDRYAEYLIVMGIMLGNYVEWVWGVFALMGMVMASFTRAKAESVGKLEHCTVGIAERQEKLSILILGSLIAVYYPIALSYAVILVGILSHVTVAQRLVYTWKQTRSK